MLNNLKVSHRLLLGFSLPIAMFVLFGIWLQLAMTNIASHVTEAQSESVPFALVAKNMEKEVIQVQQWLTDISATRGQDGLDDGFKKAEENRAGFYSDVAAFSKMYTSKNNQEKLKQIADIKTDFDHYYATGVKMARGYIDGGTAEGNRFMGEFDKASESLQNALTPFIDHQMKEMETSLVESERQTQFAQKLAAGTLILVIALALLISRFVSLSIIRPLEDLQSTISQVEEKSDFTLQVPVHGRDELAVTGQAFNHLIDRIRDIIRQTRASVDEVANISHDLSRATARAKEVASRQSDAATMVSTASEEISAAISEIVQQSNDSEALSEQGRQQAKEAFDITQQEKTDMTATASAIKESAANVSQLSESSGKISGIVTAIKEIADQTNLLALNAAIEAARAGEQGRGFAVVADEVRKLAERTAGSTEEISKLIASIQTEIGHVVEAMHGADQMAAHSVETAEVAASALVKVENNGVQINTRLKEIALSTKESNLAIQDISLQIERIAQMTEESSAAAEITDSTADRLDALATELHNKVEIYRV
ncbi:MAG: methyl-accepting chemotaxis protein [Gallionellaceae bacterium]